MESGAAQRRAQGESLAWRLRRSRARVPYALDAHLHRRPPRERGWAAVRGAGTVIACPDLDDRIKLCDKRLA